MTEAFATYGIVRRAALKALAAAAAAAALPAGALAQARTVTDGGMSTSRSSRSTRQMWEAMPPATRWTWSTPA